MSPTIFVLLGILFIGVAVEGLIRGKVRAGSRGFRTHFYSREESALIYFVFVLFYAGFGAFLVAHYL